jgi:DNA-binding LacI/PurR family transcriptional regulator
VSYVLNGVDDRHRITPETRERVLAAAARLGYEPNAAALALRSGRTEIVLIQLPEWPLGPPTTDAVLTLSDELELLGYTPLVHLLGASHPEGLARACRRVSPIGLVAPGDVLTEAFLSSARSGGVRAVIAITERPVAGLSTVVIDQRRIGRVAAQHLAGRGYRHILALEATDPGLAQLSRERIEGLTSVAHKSGLTVETVPAGLDREAMDELVGRRIARPARGTAVFAVNDAHALLVVESLRRRSIAIPRSVGVIGCDDSSEARQSCPRLTSIRLRAPDMWRRVARALHQMTSVDSAPAVTIRAIPRAVAGETT